MGIPGELRTLSFRDWLLRIEPRGSLLRYVGALEERYDSVAQIVKTYVTSARNGKILDPLFFEDMPISKIEGHQEIFQQWFEHELRLQNASNVGYGMSHSAHATTEGYPANRFSAQPSASRNAGNSTSSV